MINHKHRLAAQVRSWTAKEVQFDDDGGTVAGFAFVRNGIADLATAICNLNDRFDDGDPTHSQLK